MAYSTSVKFYLDGTVWKYSDGISSALKTIKGNFELIDNDGIISIKAYNNNSYLFRDVPVTRIEKSSTPGDYYADMAEFNTATADFFNASSPGGGSTGLYISAGTVTEPSIVYNTGLGTVTLGEGTFRFFHTVDYSGSITEHTIASNTLAISDNVTTYLIASYNSGTPVYTTTEDIGSVDDAINAVIYTVYRSGDNFSVIDWDTPGLGLSNKTHRRLIETERFARVFGFDISEYGTRNVLVSAGKVWQGAYPNLLAEANSVDDEFYLWTNNGDTTFSWAQINQYTNTQYDPKTGTLATLTDGDYGVIWLYRCMSIDCKTVHVILGNQSYDLNGAKAAQPVEVPQLFDTNTLLVGKIIVLKNAATATEIDSAFETTFAASVTTNHGGLTGRTGGHLGVYDHLPVYNADGVTPILVVDKTNNRVGIGTSPEAKLHVDDYAIAKGFGSKLMKVSDGLFETAVAGTEYYSPDQHGSLFGTIYRKYIVVPDNPVAGGLLTIPIGVTPTALLNVGGWVLEHTTNKLIPIPNGSGYTSDPRGIFAGIDGSNLLLDAADNLDWDSGYAWIDYTK